jgi:signal transduction protein with GAF and PtsI domain
MEAKAKQDKVLEIKRLTTAIAALRSEMNKYEEQLEDCRREQPLAGKTLGMCP